MPSASTSLSTNREGVAVIAVPGVNVSRLVSILYHLNYYVHLATTVHLLHLGLRHPLFLLFTVLALCPLRRRSLMTLERLNGSLDAMN